VEYLNLGRGPDNALMRNFFFARRSNQLPAPAVSSGRTRTCIARRMKMIDPTCREQIPENHRKPRSRFRMRPIPRPIHDMHIQSMYAHDRA
jgi:hypothetical protein